MTPMRATVLADAALAVEISATALDSKEDCEEPRHTGVRYGTNIVRWGIATLATYGKVAIVITIIAR